MAYHTPVLVGEVIEQLRPRDGGTYFDLTVGGGGHASEILKASGPAGRLIGIDRDSEAIEAAAKILAPFGARVELVCAKFSEVAGVARRVGTSRAEGVLIDAGVSSHQFDEAERGFSFSKESPLDMRMDRSQGETAADVVNRASAEELARIFWEYGEERRSRVIARAILRERERQPMRTTTQLAALIASISPPRRGGIHPATRAFQALRIAVNNELEELQSGLEAAVGLLNPGGRLAVISFHSLEDRIVKNFFRRLTASCLCPPGLPVCVCGHKQLLRGVTRKPIVPTEQEIQQNPRARSAKLRVAERM